jgi:hypothetical protein
MLSRLFGSRKAAAAAAAVRKDFEGTRLETFRKESRDLAAKCGQTKSATDCDQAAYVGTMVYLADLVGWKNMETYKQWQTRYQQEQANIRMKQRAANAETRRRAASLERGYAANSNSNNRNSTRRANKRA